MTGLISIYLDIFRFLAALGVFLSHAEQHAAAKGVLPPVYLDHKLVIFFFVISGYVIAASASRPDRTLANYGADRLARLSSVVIPALLLTWLLDSIGSRVSPDIYSELSPEKQSLRYLVNFFYCQQIWTLCVNPGSNAPLWSLGYEFWYYALFAVWVFVTSKPARIIMLLVTSLFIGPKIMLLFPAWVVGAMAFHAGKALSFSWRTSLVLFVGSGIAMILSVVFAIKLGLTNGEAGHAPLYYSANWLGDNIFAVIVAAHFLSCSLFSKHLTGNLEPYAAVRFIRWLASHTFSLYVYHMPLLYFVRAVGRYDSHSLPAAIIAMLVVLVIIAGLSKITEERYPALRKYLRAQMNTLTVKLQPLGERWKLFPSPNKPV
jgi:peptidoglycan/LPS O-acetylase OafA/YrhL